MRVPCSPVILQWYLRILQHHPWRNTPGHDTNKRTSNRQGFAEVPVVPLQLRVTGLANTVSQVHRVLESGSRTANRRTGGDLGWPGEPPQVGAARPRATEGKDRRPSNGWVGKTPPVSLSLLAAGYPTLDDGYDGALDSLEDADNERSEAATELDRETLATFRPAPRLKWRHGGRFALYRE